MVTTSTSIVSNIEYGITNLIFPLLVAILGTQIWNFILEGKKKKTEREEKLYGPLRFYLMLMRNNKSTRDELMSDMKKKHQELAEFVNPVEMGKMIMQHTDKITKGVYGPAVSEWWSHTEKIKVLLENFSGLIKKDDWPLINDFMYGLFLREMVCGKGVYKDTTDIFTDEIVDKGMKTFLDAVEKLQKKFLEEIGI